MSESWRNWEGRTIDGSFPLQNYLGSSDHSAVYGTIGANSEKAAIKLIPAESTDAEKQLREWKVAAALTHPNLIRIYASGRCQLDGTPWLYVVQEYAEENLAQILPERALTAEETRGMLPPILQALQDIHDNGYVHGHIQPSNILAIGDQVKLSSDTLVAANEKNIVIPIAIAPGSSTTRTTAYDPPEAASASGAASPSADSWRLGMTLVEILTQRLPAGDRSGSKPEIPTAVPQPFREIAERCVQVDASQRWTPAQIGEYLKTGRVKVDKKAAKREDKVAPVASAIPAAVAQAQSQAFTPILAQNSSERSVSDRSVGDPYKENLLKEDQPVKSMKWVYGIVAVAVLGLAYALISHCGSSSPSTSAEQISASSQPSAAQTTSAAEGAAGANVPVQTNAVRSDNPADKENGVVQRVVPEVTPGARRSIKGTIKVRVRTKVDPAGNVTKAKVESGRSSRYFSRVSLDAAKNWKFSPAVDGKPGERQWTLQFDFSRANVEASATAKR